MRVHFPLLKNLHIRGSNVCLPYGQVDSAWSARSGCSHTAAISTKMARNNTTVLSASQGDLNNVSVMRSTRDLPVDYDYAHRSLAVRPEEDDSTLRSMYRPFLLDAATTESDWISQLELSTVTKMAEENLNLTGERIKVLVLTGSLRKR